MAFFFLHWIFEYVSYHFEQMKSSFCAFKCGFLEMKDLTVIGFNILPCKMEKIMLTRQLSLLLLPDQCWESLLRVLGKTVDKHRVK